MIAASPMKIDISYYWNVQWRLAGWNTRTSRSLPVRVDDPGFDDTADGASE
jgi:hypothetical protein